MLKPLVFLVVISHTILPISCQYGSNRGPIYYTYPNPYCQRNLVPHYPIREDWLMGSWTLLYEYQQSGRYQTKCKKIEIKKPYTTLLSFNYETTMRRVTTSEIYKDNSKDVHTILATHGGPSIEARYLIDKTDGLFTKSAGRKTHAAVLVFIGFTASNAALAAKVPKMEPYDTALYAVCSHSATMEDYGGSFISEVGIMSKSGNASDDFLEHYRKLLEDDEVIDTTKLRPVYQQACDV